MVFKETKLNVIDNSGAKLVKCICIFKNKKVFTKLGDLILIVLNKKTPNKMLIVKKKVYFGVLVYLKYPTFRLDGQFLVFKTNSVIILTDKLKLLSTRLLKPLVKEVSLKFKLLLAKAKYVI